MKWIVLATFCLLACGSVEAADVGAIQGAAHASPVVGEWVEAEGVVTLIRGNGFFLQGAPDADEATSDGIFVFGSALPDVTVGDRVRVEGRVVEFTPANRPQQLSLTEIAEPEVVTLANGAALPAPILLGPEGRMVLTCWRGNFAGLGGWTFVTRISLATLQATGMGFIGLYGSTAALATTTVPTAANSSARSLRQSVVGVYATGGGDTIVF